MSGAVAHIRKAVPTLRGGQWYRDKRDPSAYAATLCGAECGLHDQSWRYARTKAYQRWLASPECPHTLCPTCAALNAEPQP